MSAPASMRLATCTMAGESFTGASYGIGVGLFWDILRFDLWRGGGRNTLEFTVKRSLWDLL